FTANTANPTPGYWRGIEFDQYTAAGSQISYATVSYGGGLGGGIIISGSSPTISNVTVQNNSNAGVYINNRSPAISSLTATSNPWGMSIYGTSSPSVSSSTISSNTAGGIYIASPASPSIQTTSITNNTGFAMSQDGAVTLGTVSGITATGNTTNGIEIRGSTAGVNTTWKSVGLPYVSTGTVTVGGASTPVLTIQAGVTVKFNSAQSLVIGNVSGSPGGLSAVGTSGSPITFTANTGSPTPGYWKYIDFEPYATASSQISYATV